MIGHYELLELISEGGMGLFYLAEQKEPVKRRVAVKIIKPGMDPTQVIARFEAERQALMLLYDPGGITRSWYLQPRGVTCGRQGNYSVKD